MSDAVTPPQIVLATNIAETAVTIDDIVCVINSGRMKEKGYDPYMVRPLGASFHLGLSLRHAIARCPKRASQYCRSAVSDSAIKKPPVPLILRCQKVSQAKAWPHFAFHARFFGSRPGVLPVAHLPVRDVISQ